MPAITSTVDWCEKNYAYSSYIAEFWNTLSSLVLFYAGVVGYIRHKHYSGSIIFIILAIVGLGSAAFHGVLSAETQMLDEIPMIFFVLQLSLNVINVTKLHHVAALHFSALVFASIVCYLTFMDDRNIDDGKVKMENSGVVDGSRRYQFYIFQFAIIVSAIYIFGNMFFKSIKHHQTTKLLYHGTSIFLCGWSCWLIDYFLCNTLQVYGNPQFHAWWHLLSAIGVYKLSSLSVILCNDHLHIKNKNKLYLIKEL